MGDLGLSGPYAVASMQESVRQRILDQLKKQQQELDNGLALRTADRADRQQQILEQEHAAALAERTQAAKETGAERGVNNLSMNALLTPEQAKPFHGTTQASTFQADQTLPSTQLASGAALPGADGTSTQVASTVKPPMLTGNLRFMGTPKMQADAERKTIMGRLMTGLPPDAPERRALEYQQATGQAPPAGIFDKTAEPLEQVAGPNGPTFLPRSQAVGKTPYHVPPQQQTVTIQTVDENGKPVTKVVSKAEALGKTFAKPASMTEQNRLASAEAVLQTGNDIIAKLSDPQTAALVGPAIGRYNTIRDFIGNPPPELAELAGQIESFALANMGVHGMRSSKGADDIKHFLDAKHTPESIVAAIKGLNAFSQHFMENEGRKPASGGTKKSATDLIKQYGGGQ